MSIFDNRIFRNASWIVLCRIAQSVLSLIVSMITARYLGPSNYGLIAYASSIVAFIVPLVQLGFNSVIVQEIVDRPDETGITLGTIMPITIASSLIGIVGIFAFTMIVNAKETDTIIVSVLYSVSMIFQMTEMIQYWYQAKLLSKYVAIVSLISRVIVSAYKIYIVVAGKSIYWFAIVNSLDYLIISICLFVIYSKLGGHKFSFSYTKARKMFSKSKHFVISGLMVSIFGQTDKIMLKLMINDETSGYYSAAITCAGMTAFLFTAVIDSFRPVIFEAKRKSNVAYKQNMIRMYSIILYMAFFQSVVLTLFADPVVSILYGENYQPTVQILRIITWYSAFSYLGSARNIWLLCEEKQKYVWIMNSIGAMINVVGNYVMIPTCGACGAALVSVTTQFATNFVANLCFNDTRTTAYWMMYAVNPKVICRMVFPTK